MPKTERLRRRPKKKRFPKGWEEVEETLAELDSKLRDGMLCRICVSCVYVRFYPNPLSHSMCFPLLADFPFFLSLSLSLSLAEVDDDRKKRHNEKLWAIFRIHHQKSRYIYDMFYNKKKISREVYNFALRHGYADANLIAKWKKDGYERLCCLRCIQKKDTNHGTACICRVPKHSLAADQVVECVHCGCRGCASTDG
jgi:bud site selection protein 31